MKKQIIMILLLGLATIIQAQKVDSIKVEQSGDFIKIGYRIIDSKPGQIYRVKVLCSINGGLNTEINSISGDIGDNVQGGKPEYFVVWDVLRDIDALTSAEFIIRTELLKDIDAGKVSNKNIELTEKWSKKWVHAGPAIEFPGFKPGFTAGIMGSFGAVLSFRFGKYAIDEDIPLVMGSITLDEFLNDKKVIPSSYFLTKRIVSFDAFQLHLMAGFERTRLIFQNSDALDNPFIEDKLYGPALGITADYKWVAIQMQLCHIDPKAVEQGTNFRAISPLTFGTFALGVRF
ncbi:MAG: hypothetical protein WD578_04165 [Bacteroidales bacterium]